MSLATSLALPWLAAVAPLALDAGAPVSAPAPVSATPPASAAPPASGPPPDVTVTCTPEVVKVGQPLVCTLVAVHPDAVSVVVTLPPGATEPSAPMAGNAAAVTRPRPDGKLETVRVFEVRAQEPKASLKVPPVQLKWLEAGGGQGQVEVPGRKVPIERLLPGEDDPKLRTFAAPPSGPPGAVSSPPSSTATTPPARGFVERLGPVALRTTNWPALIATCAFVAAVVGVGIGWLIKRWLDARRRAALPIVDTRPAHAIALERLERLEAERLPEQGRAKEFYFRLSEVVRDYLERRYAFGAPEMTSDEIRAHLRATTHTLTPEGRRAIEAFLDETDLVKFADLAPTESAADTTLRAARGIVALTRAAETSAAPSGPTSTPQSGGAA